MFYKEQYRKKAHGEIETIFRILLPENGLHVREAQILLCHQMLDTLFSKEIALCDAGVGIGKTYAYLVACILMRKYGHVGGERIWQKPYPVVISTSSIALQKAVIKEYIPFLSELLLKHRVIPSPLLAVVRKGKEHFVCDERLEERIKAIEGKVKNPMQKEALLDLRMKRDMDEVHGLSGFDRSLVCVPNFCPRDCRSRLTCRYQRYLEQAKGPEVFIQICNHNYLLADAMHRSREYRPLLTGYRALIVDEAHKLQEAAMQMYSRTFGYDSVLELCAVLAKEYQKKEAERLRERTEELLVSLKERYPDCQHGRVPYRAEKHTACLFNPVLDQLGRMTERLKGSVSKWLINRLEETRGFLQHFKGPCSGILYLQHGKGELPQLCMARRDIPHLLDCALWEDSLPVILTSGTLKAGQNFARTRQATGLEKKEKVREYVAESPFQYHKNCLLYLPENIPKVKRGSHEEPLMLAEQIYELIKATNGHTLVLFTSYVLMSSVYQLLRERIPFELVKVWRHSQEEISRFKTLKNGVLFAAGSCWEGVDFPGDMVSSLIIVRLPFAVPDPVSEAEQENYASLEVFLQSVIVPDMQKKLKQGFGRAIRTERDTCVVSILDHRALQGGKYHRAVLSALPKCRMANCIENVAEFIHTHKDGAYYS